MINILLKNIKAAEIETELIIDESDIVQQRIECDRSAFRQVFDQNYKIVLNTCYRFVFDKDAAEDIAQEVFIEVHRSIKNFRGGAKLSTWIYRIAVSKSLDYLRKQKTKKRFGFFVRINDEENLTGQIVNDRETNPVNKLENEERVKLLNRTLQTLPENQRIAFTLSKYDELSYKEIADVLSTTVSAVECLIHRAKKNLEKKLYKHYRKLF